MNLAALYLFFFSLALTLSPAARLSSWQVEYRWGHWIGFVVWLVGFAIIHRQVLRFLPECDPYLLPAGAILSGWGILTIWRIDPGFGWRQVIWLGICLILFGVGLRINRLLYYLRHYKYIWLTCGLLLTGLTFVMGTFPGGEGPRLWLGCCGVYLQPSEPLKLFLIIYLAAYMADRLPVSSSLFSLLMPTLILLAASLFLLLIQRDLGTVSIFIFLYAAIIYLSSQRRRVLLVSIAVVALAGALGYYLFDVIRLRVDAWVNPWIDPSGRSYQIVQSLLAIASGGLFGRGPGLGSPSVVPVAHSDFIFASIAEETGLIGTIALLLIIALIIGRGMLAALRASSTFKRFLAAGLSVYLCAQSILIIGGNLRLLPLTGVTLPFVSYGGSSLLISFISLLILCWISSQPEEEPALLKTSAPYLLVSGGLLAGLLAAALMNGYWSYVQAGNLLERTDNPRWAISDRYVKRGSLLDRSNQPISVSNGSPGTYTRTVLYPQLGPVIGYTNPYFGQAGLEAYLDPYLRGSQGSPSFQIWSSHLLTGSPPPGLDMRLSIDLTLQKKADDLFGNHTGALVLLNAKTGEILSILSHPYFDPNQLEANWADWVKDPQSPLLNRTTQSQYPPGTTLGPFLLALAANQSPLPPIPNNLDSQAYSIQQECDRKFPVGSRTWGQIISAGCPAASLALYNVLPPNSIVDLYRQIGLTQTPNIPLQTAAATSPKTGEDTQKLAVGLGSVRVTPLQMALAAAALSQSGMRPAPLLALSVHTPQQGWIILPTDKSSSALPQSGSQNATQLLQQTESSFWNTSALVPSENTTLTWYIGGTLPNWQGTPVALALVLEENNQVLAERIGYYLLQAATHP